MMIVGISPLSWETWMHLSTNVRHWRLEFKVRKRIWTTRADGRATIRLRNMIDTTTADSRVIFWDTSADTAVKIHVQYNGSLLIIVVLSAIYALFFLDIGTKMVWRNDFHYNNNTKLDGKYSEWVQIPTKAFFVANTWQHLPHLLFCGPLVPNFPTELFCKQSPVYRVFWPLLPHPSTDRNETRT